jgi:hypothetical protein
MVFLLPVWSDTVYSKKKNFKMGKAILLQAWTGPVGSTRVKLPDFKTIGI